MKKIIIIMLIFLLFPFFSVSVAAKDRAFILEKIDFTESEQVFENRWDYPIEVSNYDQIRIILDIRKSHERSDNEIVKTFDPVPPTSQYFPENAFKIRIYDFETYLTNLSWEEFLEKGAVNDYRWLNNLRNGLRVKPLKSESSNDSIFRVYYEVDFEDIKKTNGRYVIQFASVSDFYTEAVIRIDYPGEKSVFNPETEKYHDKLPDLVINNIRLNNENELTVTVKNIGNRILHQGYHLLSGEKAVTLIAKINGKNYGVTLQGLDPEKLLSQKPGAEVEYTFENTKINNSSKIEVYIDYNNMIFEKNKDNNFQEVELGGLKSIEAEIKTPKLNIQ